MSLVSLVFPATMLSKIEKPCSFYSISHELLPQMLENISSGLIYTRFIKLKWSSFKEELMVLLR